MLILYFMVLLAAIMTPHSVKFIFGTPKVIRVIELLKMMSLTDLQKRYDLSNVLPVKSKLRLI